jgi:hypothetical protein
VVANPVARAASADQRPRPSNHQMRWGRSCPACPASVQPVLRSAGPGSPSTNAPAEARVSPPPMPTRSVPSAPPSTPPPPCPQILVPTRPTTYDHRGSSRSTRPSGGSAHPSARGCGGRS